MLAGTVDISDITYHDHDGAALDLKRHPAERIDSSSAEEPVTIGLAERFDLDGGVTEDAQRAVDAQRRRLAREQVEIAGAKRSNENSARLDSRSCSSAAISWPRTLSPPTNYPPFSMRLALMA